jgi:transcriptional regulator of acetoin/glycerol metabolism
VALCRGGRIGVRDLPASVRAGASAVSGLRTHGLAAPRRTTLEEAERELIRRALDAAQGNRTLAAQNLGISRRTLHRRLRAHPPEGH